MTFSGQTAVADRFRVLDDPEELADYARPVAGTPGRLETILALDAVHCAACTQTIAGAIDDEHTRIEVNVVSRRARLEWDGSQRPLSKILQKLTDVGYEPRPLPLDMVERADPRARRLALWRMLVGVLCMMQVMMLSIPRYVGGDDVPGDLQTLMIWGEGMLTIPALLFAAGPFFSGAWRDFRRGAVGMDTPVALGIAVTVVTSLIAYFQGEEVYFDSVTMIIGLLLIARWLESLARERAAAGLGNSMARLPESANRLRPDGSVEQVSRRRLQPGDRVAVPAGTTFAVDGLIIEGSTEVDESLLTGEAEPQSRRAGMAVVSGSLNIRDPVVIEVTRRASDSRLAELNLLIERASTSRPAILRLADRYAGPFLVVILIVAAVAAGIWWFIDPARAPWIAAAILIVTCPCALALAAPSALLATLGALARRGIVIDRSDTLEGLAKTDVVLFDKTGTLTTSTPSIHLQATRGGLSEADAFALAAGIEHSSLHPVARAFAARAAELGVQPTTMASAQDTQIITKKNTSNPVRRESSDEKSNMIEALTQRPVSPPFPSNPDSISAQTRILDVVNLSGGGLCATLDVAGQPHVATIMPRRTLIELSILPRPAPSDATAPPSPGHTGTTARAVPSPSSVPSSDTGMTAPEAIPPRVPPFPVAPPATPRWQASFELTESVRTGAEATLAAFRAEGIRCRIVSGDHAERVQRIGQILGFATDDQQAGAKPEDKLETMRRLQAEGRRVMMVGDGINDAPVLSRADVSASLASAAPLAQHHADILLLNERLDGLMTAHRAARRAMRIVHQNLVFSCLYNVLSIPLAAAGLVPPWLAGLGMAGSSLVVVLNALRAGR